MAPKVTGMLLEQDPAEQMQLYQVGVWRRASEAPSPPSLSDLHWMMGLQNRGLLEARAKEALKVLEDANAKSAQ
jgi:hypothetical protein